ncbi:suppressor of mec-8 and unc-52 protein homolog 2 [Tanacetum coccineum]|uniref:Suppressor of mec-8 and unc-52 protein homolog 2 n=1 Tax=Tanacetum coccineum TaxID=301880 RepID=A0ABQ4X081_9ASTR
MLQAFSASHVIIPSSPATFNHPINGRGVQRTGRMAQPEWEERKPITVDKLEKDTAMNLNEGRRFQTIHVPPPESLTQRFIKSNTGNFTASPSLKGYVGDTHLVKGLDYGLLNKVRNEIVKKRETPQDDPTPRGSKEKLPVSFCTAYAKAVYQWIIKPQTTAEQNDMFLPERMAFLKNMW